MSRLRNSTNGDVGGGGENRVAASAVPPAGAARGNRGHLCASSRGGNPAPSSLFYGDAESAWGTDLMTVADGGGGFPKR